MVTHCPAGFLRRRKAFVEVDAKKRIEDLGKAVPQKEILQHKNVEVFRSPNTSFIKETAKTNFERTESELGTMSGSRLSNPFEFSQAVSGGGQKQAAQGGQGKNDVVNDLDEDGVRLVSEFADFMFVWKIHVKREYPERGLQ